MIASAGPLGARPPKQLTFPPIEFKIPHVDTLQFENGLHGYLLEDHEIPVIDITIRFKTGFPPDDKVGLDEITGWALRNGGTKNFSKETLDQDLEFVGASIESNSGPYMGEVHANFLTKDTDKVLGMLAEVLADPLFDPAKIELKKKSMIEDIRRKADDPERLGYREFAKVIYRDHPAGREATIATVTSVTPEDAAAYWARCGHPNNAVIGISGDITSQEALNKLNQYLAIWKPGGEAPVFPEMNYENVPSVNYVYKDLNQAYIWVGHMGLNSSNPDLPAANLMDYILGSGSFSSWIINRVRTEEGLAYNAGSDLGSSPWGYGMFTAYSQTRNDAAMRALGLIIELITKMKDQGPSEEEVTSARDAFVNRQVFEYETPSRVISRLTWFDITGLPLDTMEREFKAYQSATLEDVRKAGGLYLHPDGLTIVVVGNADQFDRPLSDFGKVNTIEIKKEEVPAE